MPSIIKEPNFFRENYFTVFGAVWLFIGGAVVLIDTGMILGYLYLIIAVVYFGVGYFKRHQKKAYIEWNDEKLVFNDWFQSPVEYSLSSIDAIIVSGQNLTIKSGAANGTMVDLKGYKEEDIQFLQDDLNQFISAGKTLPA
ncbi:hypothetical protein FHG64_15680 [Antarcticibacterium flavum]|uniref:Uncharacterized protein n=1 Tax=Antarcticibacterium flavum TaxID=2058175 RepID=A0A5B7X6J1_9FLAO|nr:MULTISPECIES: hypothetical protein [Antarcticibacterium]MCM4159787.1 hypothetical protein [Antarcticibacterium sp. W02-3]QCY70715.1 hypothetical protein FHG64_15680 [Antarcticibacterium flavum]